MSLRPDAAGDPLWPMATLPRLAWTAGRAAFPALARLGRALPILRLGRFAIVFRHDDVREVFRNDAAFGVVYRERLQVITGGEPFILGMADGAPYRASLAALRSLVLPGDPAAIGAEAEAEVERRLAKAQGSIEVVGMLRAATFKAIALWLGLPEPQGGSGLAVSATRLFGYQFGGGGAAPEEAVQRLAEELRRHIGQELARRRAAAPFAGDVLGRALARQAAGDAWFTDAAITTALMCLLVGGPPQPPMVAPNALDQLLRRPEALSRAVAAAHRGDDDTLRRIVREAMRFDPLAPALERVALFDATLAQGTGRDRRIPAQTRVLVAFASAMQDGRRVEAPQRFDETRPDSSYIHFGLGLHECFGREINAALLHRLLAPLLRQPGLRRSSGRAGRLSKRGVYPDQFCVMFGAAGGAPR
jgi:cytochrome P450